MPRKKTKSARKPIEIKFSFLLQEDGSILAAYEGEDPRTHAVGMAVLESIAREYNFQLSVIG
jgi:hypothetical protein